MTAFERAKWCYDEANKNRFNAWGIVVSPNSHYELIASFRELITYHTEIGMLDRIFGLVVITKNIPDDTMYVVDEKMGKAILGEWWYGHNNS